MIITKAEKRDIAALVRLRLAYLSEDTGFQSDEQKEKVTLQLPGYFERHLNEDLSVILAKEDGQIVSCAFLLSVEKPMSPSFVNGLTGTVLNVYTLPESRHRGYAKAVMKELLEEGKRKNLSVIELKATEDGYPLYESLGFKDASSDYKLMKWKND